MAKGTHPPSTRETAFECPHCGAYTTQYWYRLYSGELEHKNPLPNIPRAEFVGAVKANNDLKDEHRKGLLAWFDEMATGFVFFEKKGDTYPDFDVYNLYISRCYNCDKISVWVHDNLVFPNEKQGMSPNQDLPNDIIQVFEEARSIVGLSPRGAAALLRLCIQKLCAYLGERGKKIDEDIADLVKRGLDPLVQKSLDIVRVIGNEAVHPGVIDLNDDRDTANRLFGIVNSIADQMISHPKRVQELYEKLPEAKRRAIEKRNGKTAEDGKENNHG